MYLGKNACRTVLSCHVPLNTLAASGRAVHWLQPSVFQASGGWYENVFPVNPSGTVSSIVTFTSRAWLVVGRNPKTKDTANNLHKIRIREQQRRGQSLQRAIVKGIVRF